MALTSENKQEIIDRMIGIVPRAVEIRQTTRATYAHVVTENHQRIWRCRLHPDFADTAYGLPHPDTIECPYNKFETIQDFIDSTGIEK